MGTLQHPAASNIKAIVTSYLAFVDLSHELRYKDAHVYAFYIITEAKNASRNTQSFSIPYKSIFFVFCCVSFSAKPTYLAFQIRETKKPIKFIRFCACKSHFQLYFRKWTVRVLLLYLLWSREKLENLISWKWQYMMTRYNMITRWCTHQHSLFVLIHHICVARSAAIINQVGLEVKCPVRQISKIMKRDINSLLSRPKCLFKITSYCCLIIFNAIAHAHVHVQLIILPEFRSKEDKSQPVINATWPRTPLT